MTPSQITALEQLLADVKPGAWRATQDTLHDPVMLEVGGDEIAEMSTWDHRPDERLPEADLIVALVNAAPDLLRIARAALAWRDRSVHTGDSNCRAGDHDSCTESAYLDSLRSALSPQAAHE